MSETKTWFRTSSHSLSLEPVEVVIRNCRVTFMATNWQGEKTGKTDSANKKSDWRNYFPTKKAAILSLIERESRILQNAKNKVEDAEKSIKFLNAQLEK